MTPSSREIAVLSVGRSDFGRYRPVLSALKRQSSVRLRLLAGGSHFNPRFGNTIREIEESGFEWIPGLGATVEDDTPAAVGRAIAEGTRKLTDYFDRERPDLLVVLGDRYEMLAGAGAALGFNLPVAHIHGGAVTEGAIDELVRHALTKMSHLHLVSCDTYAERLRRMGEEPWRVHVTGAPGLDELKDLARLSVEEASQAVGLDLSKPTLLVCYHPVTLEAGQVGTQINALLRAVEGSGLQAVMTYPNPDYGSAAVIGALKTFAAAHPGRVRLLKNAGTDLYASLLSHARAMVGNSSSGIVEAPSFRLPVINIGTRQDGKIRAANVIDTGYGTEEILDAVRQAVSSAFRKSLSDLVNPYGDGKSGPRIAEILAGVDLDDRLLRKKFLDA